MSTQEGYGLGIKKKNDLPLVSIITPVLNASSVLERCIESVQAQKYANIEHLILDAGSTDNTLEILQKHSKEIAFWKTEKDKGIYDAMNKGTNLAKGDWIFFLGADDHLLDGFSEMCEKLVNPHTVYYGKVKINQKIIGFNYSAYQLASLNISHQCIFYPKVVFAYYSYRLDYKIRADHDLNIRCFGNPNLHFEYHPYLIAEYAEGGFSSTFEDKAFFKDRGRIILKNLGLFTYLRFKIRRMRHRLKGRKS